MTARLTPSESALAWASDAFGPPEILQWLPEATRYNVERGLQTRSFAGRPAPAERLAAKARSRDELRALRSRLAPHWRKALDCMLTHDGEWTARDAVIVELLCERLTSIETESTDNLGRWAADTPDVVWRTGLAAYGVALAEIDGRAFARATRGLEPDALGQVKAARGTLAEGPAAVIRDAWVALARQHTSPKDCVRALGLYVVAFVLADERYAAEQAAVQRAVPKPDRETFTELLKVAARSSRRAHAGALRELIGGRDG